MNTHSPALRISGYFNRLEVADPGAVTLHGADIYADERIKVTADAWVFEPPTPDSTPATAIAALYNRHGVDSLKRLQGEFAFALWDADRRTLFCARDAFGLRPFYYHATAGSFRFSSTISELLRSPGVSRDLNRAYLLEYMNFEERDLSLTAYSDVRALPPGHYLLCSPSGITVKRWWRPEEYGPVRYGTTGEYVEQFRELLYRSVADRMRCAQGDAAVSVSGGLDSSSVAVLAQHCHDTGRTQSAPIAYHYHFPTLNECDESRYARDAAEHARIRLVGLNGEMAHGLDFTRMGMSPDGPEFYETGLDRSLLDAAVGEGCKAWMNGWGGDVLFLYSQYRYYELARSGRLPALFKWAQALHRDGRPIHRILYTVFVRPYLPRRIRRAVNRWRAGDDAPARSWLRPGPTLPDEYAPGIEPLRNPFKGVRGLLYESIVSVAGIQREINRRVFLSRQRGLEFTCPLLDRQLAEFTINMPLELTHEPGRAGDRWLFREAMAPLLPESIRRRGDKTSWGPLLARSLQEHHATMYGILATGNSSFSSLVDDVELLRQFQDFTQSRGKHVYTDGLNFVPSLLAKRWLDITNYQDSKTKD